MNSKKERKAAKHDDITPITAVYFYNLSAGRIHSPADLPLPKTVQMAVLISFSLLAYTVFPGSYDAVGDGEIALDTDDVEISIYTQEKENHILFSDARVTNLQNGAVTECPLEFSDSGKLIGGGEALNYKADIEDLADGNFTGKSITIDAMRESSHSSLPLNTLFLLLFLFIPPFILTFLHIYIRKKMRRAQYETDLEKMKIEDLS